MAALFPQNRRRLLLGAALAPLLPLPGAVALPPAFNATFLQIWRSHMELPEHVWRTRLEQTYALGCRRIILQWVGLSDSDGQIWSMPSKLLDMIFDWSEALGLAVELGVPYDDRWWRALGSNNQDELRQYLARAYSSTQEYMSRAARWVRHPAFCGWYLPYEIEQYSWATPERRAMLGPWLHSLAELSMFNSGLVPGVSTYFSQLPSDGDLAQLWNFILDACTVRPMIQDGVGENGLSHYVALEPLHLLLLQRAVKFDLIVELFERDANSRAAGAPFHARAANYGRVHAQLRVAQHYGAHDVVAFAIDPWMIGGAAVPGAARLLAQWQAVYGSCR